MKREDKLHLWIISAIVLAAMAFAFMAGALSLNGCQSAPCALTWREIGHSHEELLGSCGTVERVRIVHTWEGWYRYRMDGSEMGLGMIMGPPTKTLAEAQQKGDQ